MSETPQEDARPFGDDWVRSSWIDSEFHKHSPCKHCGSTLWVSNRRNKLPMPRQTSGVVAPAGSSFHDLKKQEHAYIR